MISGRENIDAVLVSRWLEMMSIDGLLRYCPQASGPKGAMLKSLPPPLSQLLGSQISVEVDYRNVLFDILLRAIARGQNDAGPTRFSMLAGSLFEVRFGDFSREGRRGLKTLDTKTRERQRWG